MSDAVIPIKPGDEMTADEKLEHGLQAWRSPRSTSIRIWSMRSRILTKTG
jgi:hypothetical protein